MYGQWSVRRHGLTVVVRERSAPALSRTRTQSSLPASQARKRGVCPPAAAESTAAPAVSSTSTQLEVKIIKVQRKNVLVYHICVYISVHVNRCQKVNFFCICVFVLVVITT